MGDLDGPAKALLKSIGMVITLGIVLSIWGILDGLLGKF